jgi:hypothetical protein
MLHLKLKPKWDSEKGKKTTCGDKGNFGILGG